MKFESYQVADIFTGYLTESDLDRIGIGAPNHLAAIDPLFGETQGSGEFFYLSEPDLFEEFEKECRDYGLSSRFIMIMRELSNQGFRYVRFDADGGMIDGMKTLEEEEQQRHGDL